MNSRLLCAALLLTAPISHPALAHQDAPATPQVLAAAPQSAQDNVVENLSSLARFFDVEVSESKPNASWSKSGGRWAQLVATSRAARLPFVARRARSRDIESVGPLLARLKAPEQIVLVQAVAKKNVLLYVEGRDVLMARADFERRFTGEILSSGAPSALRIEEPVREIKLRSLGGSDEIVQAIRVHNTSSRALPIRVASTSCGCTGATVSPTILPPGGSGVLTAKMHASDSRLVTISLQSGDAKLPSSSAWSIVALQTRVPQFDPPPTLALNVAKGEAASTSGVVRLPPGARLLRISSSQPWLQATARLALASAGANAGQNTNALEIEAKLLPTAPEGRFEGAIRLHMANAALDELVVPVKGMVSNDVLAQPSALVLGAHPLGSTVRKTIIVRGPRPFSIRSVQGGERVEIKANPQVLDRAHAVEISTRIIGEVGAPQHERATLSLSDGRALDVDIFATVAKAQEPAAPASPTVGQPAPSFAARDMNGVAQSLADLRGKKNLLLTFFPKCFTGGCANHLSSLRDHQAAFDAADTQILAVSVDPADGEKGQRAFARQWNLAFPLIPDTERKLSMLYGAAQQPSDLAGRMSVFIDKQGVVRFIDTNVNVQTHGADVLAKMRDIGLAK